MRRIAAYAVTCWALLGITSIAEGGTLQINVPQQAGKTTVSVYYGNKTFKDIIVDIPDGTTASGKADLIAEQINTQIGNQVEGGANATSDHKDTITIPNATAAITNDKTNEQKLKATSVTDLGTPLFALIDYESTPSGFGGIDTEGNVIPSTFTASFGFDGFTDTKVVTFSQGLTSSLLTEQMFGLLDAGLPPDLKPFLSHTGSQILFDFPLGQSNYFVQNSTTDTLIKLDSQTFGIELTGGACCSA